MKNQILHMASVLLGVSALWSCSNGDAPGLAEGEERRISIGFTHPDGTRATDTGFEKGDKAGVFVVESGNELDVAGNVFSNAGVDFNGNGWTSDRPMYWNKGRYDFYAYYPYTECVQSVTDLPFAVAADQSGEGGNAPGYETSDFLFASVKDVEATAKPVVMSFRHLLSKITVELVKGPDFDGDLPEDAEVYIHNTVVDATIDLMEGFSTKNPRGEVKTISARKAGTGIYTAVVVPQRIDNKVPLVEVVMKGVSYLYESRFLFKQGVNHNVTLVVDKNPDQVKIEIGAEIENWANQTRSSLGTLH